jgi:TonB family protein
MKYFLAICFILTSSLSYSAEIIEKSWYLVDADGKCKKSRSLKEIYATCRAENQICQGISLKTEKGKPTIIAVGIWESDANDRESPDKLVLYLGKELCQSAQEKNQSDPDKVVSSAVLATINNTEKINTLKENYQRKFESDIAVGNTSFLSSDDSMFNAFLRRFEGAVYGVWRYPQEAALKGINGITPIRITFNQRGEITNILQLESSGAEILDKEVLRTLRAIGAVRGFPKGYDKGEFHLITFFQYEGPRRYLR